jgi:hypothetical protein
MLCIIGIYACKQFTHQEAKKEQPAAFAGFVKNFDTLSFPLILSFPGFLKDKTFIEHNLKPIQANDAKTFLKLDTLPPWPLYYYGQLPMKDSTYYLITYFEMRYKDNPSLWWTLIKFNYFGTLLSETNISYCVKDEHEIRERFCKVTSGYQCFYVENTGKWDEKRRAITDTMLSTRTINLTTDLNR